MTSSEILNLVECEYLNTCQALEMARFDERKRMLELISNAENKLIGVYRKHKKDVKEIRECFAGLKEASNIVELKGET